MWNVTKSKKAASLGAEQATEKRVGGKSEGENEEANLEAMLAAVEDSGFDCEGNVKSLKCSEQRRKTHVNFKRN